jgi:hypothetical protein
LNWIAIVKLAALAAVCAAAVAAVLVYRNAIAEAEQARQEAAELLVVVEQQADVIRRTEAALRKREADRTKLLKERDRARQDLAELLKRPEVAGWASHSLPDAVIRRLQRSADSATPGPAGQPDRADR